MLNKDVMKKEYKSPPHKLIKFFEDSRDNWKKKYSQISEDLTPIKDENRRLKKQLQNYKDKLDILKQQNEELKKNVFGLEIDF
jgi:chromosome segregation ATPase